MTTNPVFSALKTFSERYLKKSAMRCLSSLSILLIILTESFSLAQDSANSFSLRCPQANREVVSIEFVGSNPNPPAQPFFDVQSPFTPSIYRPNTVGDPGRARTGTPSDRKVVYKQLYTGIDLVCYGFEGQLAYDFMIGPWADSSLIRIRYLNSDTPNLSGKVPAYQLIDGLKVPVEVTLIKQEDASYIYQIGRYDKNCDLIVSSIAPQIQVAKK